MANPVHVELVRRGKDSIDAWRRSHRDERLDLYKADLSSVDLSGVTLAHANMHMANLSGSNLSEAFLLRARLTQANLTMANLTEANLSVANLSYANLTRCSLSRAVLRDSNLEMADLSEADLCEANLIGTTFRLTTLYHTRLCRATFGYSVIVDCDLRSVLGLDSAIHVAPSSIGLDTIAKSGGNISSFFMRGAGVPDNIATHIRSLVTSALRLYTCFISYASPDQAFADRLYADLQEKGVRCWLYTKDAMIGRHVWENIDQAIHVYDKLIVICSEASLNSPAVLREIERALEKEDSIRKENWREQQNSLQKGHELHLRDPDVLLPVRIDDYITHEWEHYRKVDVISRNVGDFVDWYGDTQKYERSLTRLLHALDPESWPIAE